MSIRQKLFVAFLLVAAISIAALLLLARDYTRSVRAELDSRFIEDARAAFGRQADETDRRLTAVEQAVAGLARAPDVLAPALTSTLESSLFDAAPAITRIGIWDAHQRKIVRLAARGGPSPDDALTEALDSVDALSSPNFATHHHKWSFEVAPGSDDTWRIGRAGHRFVLANVGPRDAPDGSVVAELDLGQLFAPTGIGRGGHAFLVHAGAPLLTPDEAARLRQALPGLARLIAHRPPRGQTTDVDDGHGQRYRVYSAVSSELPIQALQSQVEDVALIPLDELYAPLEQINVRVLLSTGVTVLLALAAALLLSGWFVGDVARIRSAVTAFAKGDWTLLEKSSRDELGGGLIDSLNSMATAVAERMRRDEADSWRRLVRVLSHEINNTLAPVRSVAATLRSGLHKRLRAEDAGEDVELALRLIVERVDALASFIDGYAEVAKLPAPDRHPVDVGRLMADATALFREQAEVRNLALQVFTEDAGLAELDGLQMERVLVNLVKNAIEASPDCGAIVVRSTRGPAGLEITVADDGPGISPEARRNLFVPYFTTKPGGSGIGLTLARQIIVAHGGTLTAELRPSGGTLMRIVVPDVAPAHRSGEAP